MQFNIVLTFGLVFISCVVCQGKDDPSVLETAGVSGTTTEATLSTTPTAATTTATNTSCEANSGKCEDCVKNIECYFCESDNQCRKYPFAKLVPKGECSTENVRYSTCAMSLKLIIILSSVLGGIVLIFIITICCWCCCKRKGNKLSKDDLKWARQREERKLKAEEKKKERAARTDEIRRKYGLLLDASGLVKDDNPYQRFDA